MYAFVVASLQAITLEVLEDSPHEVVLVLVGGGCGDGIHYVESVLSEGFDECPVMSNYAVDTNHDHLAFAQVLLHVLGARRPGQELEAQWLHVLPNHLVAHVAVVVLEPLVHVLRRGGLAFDLLALQGQGAGNTGHQAAVDR